MSNMPTTTSGLPDTIMEAFKSEASKDKYYVNKIFLSRVAIALMECYGMEDDTVNEWIDNMDIGKECYQLKG